MRPLLPVAVRCVGLALITWLATACSGRSETAHPVSVQDVQSIEIRYQSPGGHQPEEVHRLVPGSGRRSFVRRSTLQTAAGEAVSSERVPAQRVSELLWAMSAPAWSRARGVERVARRFHPAGLIERAKLDPQVEARGCTAEAFDRQLRTRLRGGGLHSQLDAYYLARTEPTEVVPSMLVVVEYRDGTSRVFSSHSPRLQMLPWRAAEPDAPNAAPTPNWSVAVSQAVQRVLPPASKAAARLQLREDPVLAANILAAAEKACSASAR